MSPEKGIFFYFYANLSFGAGFCILEPLHNTLKTSLQYGIF